MYIYVHAYIYIYIYTHIFKYKSNSALLPPISKLIRICTLCTSQYNKIFYKHICTSNTYFINIYII